MGKTAPELCVLLAFLLYLNSGCAFQVAPSGGPEDRTPPEVVSSFPPLDSTNIRTLETIRLKFSENIEKSSVKDQVWMLPTLPEGFEIQWKGNDQLLIRLKSPLQPDQTYILTLGTGIKDWHGNRMAEPFVLPFSTGRQIDKGRISGIVVAEKVENVLIYAYPSPDSLSATFLFQEKPPYYVPVARTGRYSLGYLKSGKYLIFALLDNDKNGLYNVGVDQIGIPPQVVRLDSSRWKFEGLNLKVVREDTTAPQLLGVRALSRKRLRLTFSEPVAKREGFYLALRDSISATPLRVLAAEVAPENQGNLLVFTSAMAEEAVYLGDLWAVADTSGNAASKDTLHFRFNGSDKADTTQARIKSISPRPGARNVAYQAEISLLLSLPVDTVSLKEAVSVLAPDSTELAGRWFLSSLLRPAFRPDSLLLKNSQYAIRMDLTKLKSVFGDAFGDSLYSSTFTTWDWAELGEISGRISAENSAVKQAFLWAREVRSSSRYAFFARVGQPYLFPFLPDGLYLLKAALDVNGNKRLDKGSTMPLNFSEPFQFYPDTVKVRKRWTTDGIDFHFNY